jgi:hypothetical protein
MGLNPISGRYTWPGGPDPSIGAASAPDQEIIDSGIVFTGEPASHVLLFTGVTLSTNSNIIRGIDVAPKRTSGWTAFTGTITTTPAPCYMDYRELHTAGVAEVLGIGCFPFMDSGASCASMFAGQFICEVDAGATVLTAGGAEGIGIFPIFAKLLLNGETFNSGGVGAAIWLSVQANVTDVSAENVALIHGEIASGGIRSILYLKATGGAGAEYLLEIADDLGEPAQSTSSSVTNVGANGWIKVKVGSAIRYIALGDGVT